MRILLGVSGCIRKGITGRRLHFSKRPCRHNGNYLAARVRGWPPAWTIWPSCTVPKATTRGPSRFTARHWRSERRSWGRTTLITRHLNNLAVLYHAPRRLRAGRAALPSGLGDQKKVLGENHPDYATSLNNLAALYDAQGDYARAEPLYRQALEIRKKALGENHPDYALSLNNLAALYQDQGDYARAEPLYRQALEIRKKVLGENHPDYASSLNNLALLYRPKATTRGPSRFSVRPWRSGRRLSGRTTPIMPSA